MRISVLLAVLLAVPAFGEFAEVHGVKMYYEIHGEGRPVMLLHGGLASIHLSFAKQIPVLARNHRVIAIEQVGHGHTPDVVGRNFTYEDMTEDTAALMGQLGIANADVIGWSDGGQLALRLAATHPELVRRVIASGVGLNAATPEDAARVKRSMELLAPGFWPAAVDEYKRVSPDGPEHWPVFFAKVRAMWAGASRGIAEQDLAKIKAPALIIAGDQENVERHTHIFRRIAGAKLCILPATGHGTFMDRPDWLNPILLEFLDHN
jgi:pimeloyl-ACP methyl ester carboxylesterase